jgi:adenine-specific DNA-methyltransferase
MARASGSEIQQDPSLGQVWTPPAIAKLMIDKIKPYSSETSNILDPASGPGTFFEFATLGQLKFHQFACFEIDGRFVEYQRDHFINDKIVIYDADFLKFNFHNAQYDIAILNPPYKRHELISQNSKKEIDLLLNPVVNRSFSKRMNYFGYFLIYSSVMIKPGGVMCAIVYDSLNSTQYGQELIAYLSETGKFISRETVTTPFEGRMIDAEILLWQKNSHAEVDALELQFELASQIPKGFCLLNELAVVKRGTSFLKRNYFVSKDSLALSGSTPMVSKQPLTSGLLVQANTFGLFQSLNHALDVKYLEMLKTSHDDEKLKSLKALPAPVYGKILFNYFIRHNPRHLLNELNLPASDNFYCVTPKNEDLVKIHWVVANSRQYVEQLINSSRLQGSGLRKLQLFEYANSLIPDYRNFSAKSNKYLNKIAQMAINEKWDLQDLSAASTSFLEELGY